MLQSSRMPAVFFGHGNPLNAIQRNAYTEAWSRIGRAMPRPRGVLAVSAHWFVPGTWVTGMTQPRTIHDFGGFPRELYEVRYPAPGDPALASRVQSLLAPASVGRNTDWGLDHGTWSVLCHVFPNADVPVVQLSLDETQPPAFHYELGKRLAPLRDEGIFVMGTGNLVHNLHTYGWGRRSLGPYDWALRFEERARTLIRDAEDGPLIAYETLGADARLSVPTPEHYLPLLYVLALRAPGDDVRFPVEGFDGGSVSMTALRVG